MNNDWLDMAILEDYLDGKLDAKTMNRVEREALEDPFIAEALAGLSTSPGPALESISLLQKQLKERIEVRKITKKTSVITWQRLSIAATAAVLFIAAGIIFWMKQVNYQQMTAKQSKRVEVVIAPMVPDSSGYGAHQSYIIKNNIFKDEPKIGQSVELSFTIGKDGVPENIKIIKGIADKYDHEAIRLIHSGPKWEVPKKGNSKIAFKIDF